MSNINTWEDIEDVLYDGKSYEIENLVCPTCKAKVHFSYSKEFNSLEYGCNNCGIVVRASGCHQVPNCAYIEK